MPDLFRFVFSAEGEGAKRLMEPDRDRRRSWRKAAVAALCVLGVSAVAWGMAKKDNATFTIGLVCIVAGYLFIRREMKKSVRDNQEKNSF